MARRNQIFRKVAAMKKSALGIKEAAVAIAAGSLLAAGNFANSVKDKAVSLGSSAVQMPQEILNKHQKSTEEVITMKKSTMVWLLVALGAVAGVLGALYVYVLRREKELDEYEQLLFSEEFNDDLSFDEEPEPATAE